MHELDSAFRELGKSTNERNSLQLAIGETHCLFQFCIERFQSIRRLFFATLQLPSRGSPTYRGGTAMAKRPRCGSSAEAAHGRPRTTSCGFEATETIPFP